MKAYILLLVGFVSAGCTSVNKPLNDLDASIDGRKANATPSALIDATVNGDGWFVGMAISGGGSRSANFAAAVMFELQRLGLLERVDAISGVSGGTLTAATYCLAADAEWNPGTLQRQMTHAFASDMFNYVFQPWNAIALSVSDLDRSDVLAQSFDRHLFKREGRTLTFNDLRKDRPRLLINATDLQSGQRFIFCNEHFDRINSDLASYPIAYACAASSSVPVVLHQVTLRDYSTVFNQYRHFVDGGIVDNLGVLTLLDSYRDSNSEAEAKKKALPYSRGAILFLIDCGTQFNARLSDKGDVGLIEGLGTGAKLSSAKLLARASSATLADLIVEYAPADLTAEQIRQLLADLGRDGVITTKDRNGRPLTLVHIALSRAATLKKLPFQAFAQSLDAIDTYFDIAPADAHNLYQAANLIVEEQFEEKLKGIREALDAK